MSRYRLTALTFFLSSALPSIAHAEPSSLSDKVWPIIIIFIVWKTWPILLGVFGVLMFYFISWLRRKARAKTPAPYRITYETMHRPVGGTPKTIKLETAEEAWNAVLALTANAEETIILDPSGRRISQQELRQRAEAREGG
jgi:hypothetical protein